MTAAFQEVHISEAQSISASFQGGGERQIELELPPTGKTILNDLYELERTLGKGISCKVKLGKDIKTGCNYALKIFYNDDFNEMAETEIEALSLLRHPNIVGIHDFGQGILVSPKRDPQIVNYIALEFLA